MSKQTVLTIAQQEQFLNDNYRLRALNHKWSTRGYGSSRIFDSCGNALAKATGCGYDRLGSAMGEVVCDVFPEEVLKLAKRECKGPRRNYKKSAKFYGLFYNAVEGKAWIDGACGFDCVKKILNKIGFSLDYVGGDNNGVQGSEHYTLSPLNKRDRRFL